MKKIELVKHIAQCADISNKDADLALSAMLQGITEAMAQGEEVSLVGFGTFKVSERAARTGRNPKTGEEIQIAASKVPAFKAGKGLKEAVNAG